jgi:hypothetical protein
MILHWILQVSTCHQCKILNTALIDAAVKDLVNLKLLITFNQDRWRWKSGPPARDGALEPNWNNHYSTTKD